MRTTSRLLMVPALLLGLVLAGCGGGEEEASTTSKERPDTVSFADWSDDVNKYCRAADKATEDLPEPQDESDYATLEESAVQTKRLVGDFVSDVRDLGIPDRNAATAEEFLATYERFEGAVDDLIAAARDEDPDAVNRAVDTIDTDQADRDELAQQLGLDDCWEPDGATDDGTDTTETTVDDTSGNLPTAEWQSQVDDACSALNPQYNVLADMDPGDLESLQTYAAGLTAFMNAVIAEFDRIGPPADDPEQAQALYDILGEMASAAQEMTDHVAASDLEAAVDAATRFDDLGQQLNPVAEELGIPSCGGF